MRAAHLDTTHAYFNGPSLFLKVHGLETTRPRWDQWISDPTATPAEKQIIHVYVPLE